jgi:hypothetical protein
VPGIKFERLTKPHLQVIPVPRLKVFLLTSAIQPPVSSSVWYSAEALTAASHTKSLVWIFSDWCNVLISKFKRDTLPT